MKKYLSHFLLCLFVCQTSFVNAQLPAHRKARRENGGLVKNILREQYLKKENDKNGGAKTTSTIAERLKSFCGYNFEDTAIMPRGKSDSGYFVYSGQRGSWFNFQNMDYGSPSLATATSPVGEDYLLSFNYDPYFPSVPIIGIGLQMYADTAWLWNSYCPYGVILPDTFGYAAKVNYSYVGNRLSEETILYYPPVASQTDRYDYYYDASSRLDHVWIYMYNTSSSTWDTTNAASFFYNTSGQLIMDSSSVNTSPWSEDGKDVFSYDGSGNITFHENYIDSFGYWQPEYKSTLTYYPGNLLHTDSVSMYTFYNGGWTSFVRDSFGYTPGASFFTYCLTKGYQADTVFEKAVTSKHVSGTGLPDTIYYKLYFSTFGGPVQFYTGIKTSFTYDTYKNPVVAEAHAFNITDTATEAGFYISAIDRIFYYHYETYMSDAVKNVTVSNEKISVYPNPANDAVNISRPDAMKGSYTSIAITNMTGQMIRTISLPWMNETETISLGGLPGGIYLLTIKDGKGNSITTQRIEKK